MERKFCLRCVPLRPQEHYPSSSIPAATRSSLFPDRAKRETIQRKSSVRCAFRDVV